MAEVAVDVLSDLFYDLATDDYSKYPAPKYTSELISGLFPERWNLYHKKSHLNSKDFLIGPHNKEPYFLVNYDGTWSLSTKLTLTRYDPDKSKREELARIVSKGTFTSQAVISVPSAAYEGDLKSSWSKGRYSFVAPVPAAIPTGSYPEMFEWRETESKEAKKMGGSGSGWKLVRASRNAPAQSQYSQQPPVLSSDGKEVVAIWVENSYDSFSKHGRFRFIGSGATGELGRLWAIVAVASICRIYQVEEEP